MTDANAAVSGRAWRHINHHRLAIEPGFALRVLVARLPPPKGTPEGVPFAGNSRGELPLFRRFPKGGCVVPHITKR